MVLAIAGRSIASRWLTLRKSPGKICRYRQFRLCSGVPCAGHIKK
jgi:hypothetical protein